LNQAKENLILLHPMPRSDEIPSEIDNTVFAKYFNQVSYGKLIRSTLLYLIFTENSSF
jgi:aspartate carbamoyltransferase catalytic subunit